MKYEFEWQKPEFDWSATTHERRFVWQIPLHIATIVTLASEQDLLELVESYQGTLSDDDTQILVALYHTLGARYEWREALERAELIAFEWLKGTDPERSEYLYRLELATYMSFVIEKYDQYYNR
jgi:hypothetical protein